MPAPLDLTGQKYGKLTVMGRAGTVKFGRAQSAWRCRCDCGAEIVVPIVRLRTKNDNQRVGACPDCRARPCLVCGTPILPPSSATACSEECRREALRIASITHYYRAMADPDWRAARSEYSKSRYLSAAPEKRDEINRSRYQNRVAEAGRDALNEAARERRIARVSDPDYRDKIRQQRAAWLEKNRIEARKYSREYRRRLKKLNVGREIGEIANTGDKNADNDA